MKIRLIIKGLASVLLLCLSLGCGKLELLKDAQPNPVDAGSNLKNITFADFLAQDHSNDLTRLGKYAEAIEHAGLKDLLGQQDDVTLLFLTDQAVNTLVSSLGYSTVAEVPPVVLRNILSDNIFKGRLKSFDLEVGETKKFETINGSFIYYTRTSSTSDNYILTANKSTELSSPSASIRSQNLEFKNGIAHVTDQFTFYKQIDAVPDAPSGGVGNLTDTFYVTKDLYVQNGNANKNKNFNNSTSIDMKNSNGKDVSVDRMALFQFPLTTPSFGKKIGLAKLNFYIYFTGLPSSLSVYEGAQTDFDETAVTFVTAPTYNRVSLTNATLNAGFTGWIAMDVTSSVSQLYGNNQSFVNVLMNHNTDNFVKIYPREYSAGKYAAFLTVSSPPESILTLVNLNQVTVTSSGIAVLNTEHLKMAGTADKNISYTISKVPDNGYLVKYGVPLPVNASFSQTDLTKGAIKYLYSGSGSKDEFEVEAKDFNGGYYKDPLKVVVNIQ